MDASLNDDPVVIVGISVRFPQDASSPRGLWELLCDGRSALTPTPKNRYNVDAFYHPNADHGGTVSKPHLGRFGLTLTEHNAGELSRWPLPTAGYIGF